MFEFFVNSSADSLWQKWLHILQHLGKTQVINAPAAAQDLR
jgi:hypothetical protein